jgi:hypothetical protein
MDTELDTRKQEVAMNDSEIKFLCFVKRYQGTAEPVHLRLPVAAGVQSLLDRGYLQTYELAIPCLGTNSEGVGLMVTEAGHRALGGHVEC